MFGVIVGVEDIVEGAKEVISSVEEDDKIGGFDGEEGDGITEG